MHIVKKLLSIFLAMLLLFSSAAVGGAGLALTASAAETGKAIRLVQDGKADYITGAQTSNVWFGNYKQSSDGADGFNVDPIKWRVLSNADGKLFLLADRNLDVLMYDERYNETHFGVTWETCTLRRWLNGYDGHPFNDTFIDSALTGKELSAVVESELENADSPLGTPGGADTTDKVFLLSIAEATNTAYGFTDNGARLSTNTAYVAAGGHTGSSYHGVDRVDRWWLRSPGKLYFNGNFSYHAAYVTFDGSVEVEGRDGHEGSIAVRPALNLDLNSVLFTSAAVGGEAGNGVAAVKGYDGADWKLTVLDDSRADFAAVCTKDENGVRTITYSGAATGENEKISAMIVSPDGVVTYYGVLGDAKTGENTVTVDLADKLHDGDKLYVFNEQRNGNYKTDYASALVDVTSTILPDLLADKTDLKTGINTNTAQTIWYGGSKWRVIGYDGAGVASESGTMTLFANAGMGASYFDFDGRTGKQYAGSDLEKQTNQIYNNAFSDPEQFAVQERTLNAGTYDGANTDGVAGSSVGYARLWPLSTKEAYAVSANLRKDTGAWWLRSPGDGVNNVAFVKKEGDVDHIGQSFLSSSGVRPAFMVDLDKVIFASAAVGGKQGDGVLTPVEESIGGECKLTLWESRRQWFTVTETEASGIARETFTLHYQYAETGENEYISAIVTDADGNALYYGRIMQPTDENGTIEITIPADLAKGVYTLKVFNEQYNGDRKTDYAGKINQVALTVYGGNSKALQMTESGTAENILGTQQSNIWFGSYQQSSDGNGGYNVDPIKWRVLSNDGGKLFLLSDRSLDAKIYYPQPQDVTWAESTIRSWLNGYDGTANMAGEDHSGDSFKGSAFTETEFAAVAETDVVTENSPEFGTPGGSDTKDKVFLLSLAEAINTVYGFTNSYDPTGTRVSLNTDYAKECSTDYYGNSYSVGEWWLRSPGRDGFDAVYIENDGSVYEYGLRVFHEYPCVVRPALNVKLNKVIFTSAAEGGKEGDGLTTVPYYDGADWKLTVLDADRSSFTASCDSANGDVRTVNYSGAKTGDNEYISAVIVDGDGAVTYYGRLCKAASGDNNTVTVDVSGKMNDGDKLYVFNEQYNGDKKTDYASALKEIVSPIVSASTLQQGDTFEMGMYPQTEVTDNDTIYALEQIRCPMTNYGYIKNSTETVDMTYADIAYNGDVYRRVTIKEYRPLATDQSSINNNQERNGYSTGIGGWGLTYYFKWEPITWQVLAKESDGVYVMSKSLLDAQAYNNNNEATTWETGSLRSWLNDGFYNAAFSAAEQAKTVSITHSNENSPSHSNVSGGNDTTDRLWVLSHSDAINSDYGFSPDEQTRDEARKAQGTDYAKSQGLLINRSTGNSNWWLRSPGINELVAPLPRH